MVVFKTKRLAITYCIVGGSAFHACGLPPGKPDGDPMSKGLECLGIPPPSCIPAYDG